MSKGTVYIGSQHALSAFNSAGCGHASCSPLWQAVDNQEFFGGSPAVAKGRVYQATYDGFAAAGVDAAETTALLRRSVALADQARRDASAEDERAGRAPLLPPSLLGLPGFRRGLCAALLLFPCFGANGLAEVVHPDISGNRVQPR